MSSGTAPAGANGTTICGVPRLGAPSSRPGFAVASSRGVNPSFCTRILKVPRGSRSCSMGVRPSGVHDIVGPESGTTGTGTSAPAGSGLEAPVRREARPQCREGRVISNDELHLGGQRERRRVVVGLDELRDSRGMASARAQRARMVPRMAYTIATPATKSRARAGPATIGRRRLCQRSARG